MMQETRTAVVAVLAAALLLTSGCGRGESEPATSAGQVEMTEITGGVDTVFAAVQSREALPTSRIYYTLTDHEWYARGEPLVHEGTAYLPGGNPVAASLEEMEQAGDYHGVDYYVRPADERPALYVPVFEGYWQPFRPDTARGAR
jgi:hypothetical protein